MVIRRAQDSHVASQGHTEVYICVLRLEDTTIDRTCKDGYNGRQAGVRRVGGKVGVEMESLFRLLPQGALLQIRQQPCMPSHPRKRIGLGRRGNSRRQAPLRIMIEVQSQAELLKIVGAVD